jgi:uncharacterized SAM-dependent methyltransferase
LRTIRRHCGNGGRLPVDFTRERIVLETAYDDGLGGTTAFNRNLLRVADRRLGAGSEPRRFRPQAQFSRRESRVGIP